MDLFKRIICCWVFLVLSLLSMNAQSVLPVSNNLDFFLEKLSNLDEDIGGDSIVAMIDSLKIYGDGNEQAQQIVLNLLSENHAIYQQKGSAEVIRLRGYILASFEKIGVPKNAVALIISELSLGKNPYLIAAAAIAIRGTSKIPSTTLPYLIYALQLSFYHDDEISFERYQPNWPLVSPSSAGLELVKTLNYMGENAYGAKRDLVLILEDIENKKITIPQKLATAIIDLHYSMEGKLPPCCQKKLNEEYKTLLNRPIFITPVARAIFKYPDLALQDEQGKAILFKDYFNQPTVVAFFYTRCNNPNKCSMTISKLAQLQNEIANAGLSDKIQIAAITYDPSFDRPIKLQQYGANRGLQFNQQVKAMRIKDNFDAFQNHFELQVSYQSNLVSFHSVELYLLDKKGRISYKYPRMGWSNVLVISNLENLLSE